MATLPKRRKGCTINVSPEVYQELMVRKHQRAAELRRNVTFDDILGELLGIDNAKPAKEARKRVSAGKTLADKLTKKLGRTVKVSTDHS